MDLQGKKINFLGDSITEGHGTSHPDRCFVSVLKESLGLAEARNYGIGGTRYARQANLSPWEKWDQHFCARVAGMDRDADLVLVFGGTNDYGHGDAPLGNPADRTEDTFWGACHVLYRRLMDRFPGVPVVVLTPLHRTGEGDPRGDCGKAVPSGPLCEYVQIIRRVAGEYGLPVLDLYAVSALDTGKPGVVETYVPDGLHPNDPGHRILAAEIGAFLKGL